MAHAERSVQVLAELEIEVTEAVNAAIRAEKTEKRLNGLFAGPPADLWATDPTSAPISASVILVD